MFLVMSLNFDRMFYVSFAYLFRGWTIRFMLTTVYVLNWMYRSLLNMVHLSIHTNLQLKF